MKKIVQTTLILVMMMTVFISFLSLIGYVGRAYADVGSSEDPVQLITQLYEFMRTGKGTVATGVAMMLVVWVARNMLGRFIPWFKTMIGGYVLNFSTSSIAYVGVALMAEEGVSLSLLGNAVGSAFTASGGWEAFRDLFTKIGKPASTLVSFVLITALAAAPGCGPISPPVIGSVVVDCLSEDRAKIDALISEFAPLVTEGKVNWSVVYQRAKQAGKSIGGCFLGELVNNYLGGVRLAGQAAPTVEAGWEARAYLELYRTEELNGATLKTKAGNL